jgi:hypothetical protein
MEQTDHSPAAVECDDNTCVAIMNVTIKALCLFDLNATQVRPILGAVFKSDRSPSGALTSWLDSDCWMV